MPEQRLGTGEGARREGEGNHVSFLHVPFDIIIKKPNFYSPTRFQDPFEAVDALSALLG